MSNTVMDERGVLTREMTVSGITFPVGTTPEQRAAALAEGMQKGTYAPQHNGNGPPLSYHTSGTLGRMARGDAAANPPPPSALPKAPPPPAELEASNRASIPTPTAPVQVDEAGIEALNKGYRQKMEDAATWADSPAKERAIAQIRAQFQEEMLEFQQGRRLGESRKDFRARLNAPVDVQQPDNLNMYTLPDGRIAQVEPTGVRGWVNAYAKAAGQDGIPVAKVNREALYGYSLPPGVTHVSPQIFALLAGARRSGVTQKQINDIMSFSLKVDEA